MTVNDQPRQRSNTFVGLFIALVIIGTIVLVWFFRNSSNANNELRQVTYQVEATGGYAQIIYTDFSGNTTDAAIFATPFNKTINLPVGEQVYLTASNPSQTGTIVCKIKINNRDWKESRGVHPIDSVACGGIIK